jgi:hypothetical protein
MATKKKAADKGFLKVAAQTIGATLGQLAKKAGVVAAPAPVKKKAVAKKKVAVVAKKKAPVKKTVAKKKSK